MPSLGSTVSKHLTQVQDAELGVAGRMRHREVRLEGRPGEEVEEDQRWLSIYLSRGSWKQETGELNVAGTCPFSIRPHLGLPDQAFYETHPLRVGAAS